MPITFFNLPRELRDAIYHLAWLDSSVIPINTKSRISIRAWYDFGARPMTRWNWPEGSSNPPRWLRANKSMLKEGVEAFNLKGVLIVSLPSDSEACAYDLPIGLSPLVAREVHILSNHHHTGFRTPDVQKLISDLMTTKTLKVVKISLRMHGGGQSDTLKAPNLSGLWVLLDLLRCIDKLEITVDERFVSATTQDQFELELPKEFEKMRAQLLGGATADLYAVQEPRARKKWCMVFKKP